MKASESLAKRLKPVESGEAFKNLTLPRPIAGVAPVSVKKTYPRLFPEFSPVINNVYFKLGFKILSRLAMLEVFIIVVVVVWLGEGLTWKGVAIELK